MSERKPLIVEVVAVPFKCPFCSARPVTVITAFRFYVECDNPKCPKQPRGRQQAIEQMAVRSWNWQAQHDGFFNYGKP